MLSLDNITVVPPEGDIVVDPMAWFDSPGPFELEIGCGKGGFLVSRASANPHIRMLGIEWANKFYKFAADRMVRRGLANVRLMRTDAKTFVLRNLPPSSVNVLHLYHPDPWPKKKHHKRRLVQPDFVAATARMLKPRGRWLMQTDHQDYFTQMTQLLDASAWFERALWQEALGEPNPDWQGTNYEIKYSREGRAIYRAAYKRRLLASPDLDA